MKTSWECHRCKAVNAPHVDQCPCSGSRSALPYYYPSPWWYPTTPLYPVTITTNPHFGVTTTTGDWETQ